MATNVSNVSAGKPKVGGAIYTAPLGTPLPVNAIDDLDAAFKCLGYISDTGLVNSNSASTNKVKAWGGDNVLNLQEDKPDDFKFRLIESLNVEVLKHIYGANHVTGTSLATGIKVEATSDEAIDQIIVADMVMRGDVLKRIVLPQAKLTAVGDITYADNSPVGYDCTESAMPDATGKTHYEYLQSRPVITT